MQLTATEYSTWYSKVLKEFAKTQTVAWQESVYKVRKNYSPVRAKMLFLFAYALNTWEHSDSAHNYLTEEEVQFIIAKTNSL